MDVTETIGTIEGFALLEKDWLEPGAVRPNDETIALAVKLARTLGHGWFAAPSGEGEICLETDRHTDGNTVAVVTVWVSGEKVPVGTLDPVPK